MPKEKHNDSTVNVRMPAELLAEAQAKARRERRPLSEVLRDLLRNWVTGKASA